MRSSKLRGLFILSLVFSAAGCSHNTIQATDRGFNEEMCRESKREKLDPKLRERLSRFCEPTTPQVVPARLIFHHVPTIQATVAHCFANDGVACDILAKACPDLGGTGWCSDETGPDAKCYCEY